MDIFNTTQQKINNMVLKHEQQINDLAEHLLERKQSLTPTMEFKKEKKEWVGLTDEDCKGMSAGDKVVAMWANRTLKEKNNV